MESKDDDENDSNGGVGDDDDGVALRGSILAGVLLVGVVGGFGTAGYVYRDQISAFLIQFSAFIEGIFLPFSEFLMIWCWDCMCFWSNLSA